MRIATGIPLLDEVLRNYRTRVNRCTQDGAVNTAGCLEGAMHDAIYGSRNEYHPLSEIEELCRSHGEVVGKVTREINLEVSKKKKLQAIRAANAEAVITETLRSLGLGCSFCPCGPYSIFLYFSTPSRQTARIRMSFTTIEKEGSMEKLRETVSSILDITSNGIGQVVLSK